MRKTTKIFIKLIGILLVFFFNNFLDVPTLMESIEENTDIENSKESWLERMYKNKLLIIPIILIIIIGIVSTTNLQQDNLFNIFESLKGITQIELYTYLELLVIDILNENEIVQESLEKILELFDKDQNFIKQIKDPEEFKKLIIRLIEELRKK